VCTRRGSIDISSRFGCLRSYSRLARLERNILAAFGTTARRINLPPHAAGARESPSYTNRFSPPGPDFGLWCALGSLRAKVRVCAGIWMASRMMLEIAVISLLCHAWRYDLDLLILQYRRRVCPSLVHLCAWPRSLQPHSVMSPSHFNASKQKPHSLSLLNNVKFSTIPYSWIHKVIS